MSLSIRKNSSVTVATLHTLDVYESVCVFIGGKLNFICIYTYIYTHSLGHDGVTNILLRTVFFARKICRGLYNVKNLLFSFFLISFLFCLFAYHSYVDFHILLALTSFRERKKKKKTNTKNSTPFVSRLFPNLINFVTALAVPS